MSGPEVMFLFGVLVTAPIASAIGFLLGRRQQEPPQPPPPEPEIRFKPRPGLHDRMITLDDD
jgi:hypothetical protein